MTTCTPITLSFCHPFSLCVSLLSNHECEDGPGKYSVSACLRQRYNLKELVKARYMLQSNIRSCVSPCVICQYALSDHSRDLISYYVVAL